MWFAAALGLLSCWLLPQSRPDGPQPLVHHRFTIALDPGHGGENLGCLAFDGSTREKEVTLELAQAVERALTTRLPQAVIFFTRATDTSTTLADRVKEANAQHADVFISLHANASPNHAQSGFETFVLDAKAGSREDARTARRENDDGLIEATVATSAPEVTTMLRQLGLAAEREAALRLAAAIQKGQADRFPSRQDRGVRQAPFDILMGTRMPAVLFEAGFLDHPAEGSLLVDPGTQRSIAEGIADAVVAHYREQVRSGALTTESF